MVSAFVAPAVSNLTDVAYPTYTPTVTQSGAVSTFTINDCYFKQVGKFVHCYGLISVNNAGAAAGSNPVSVTLPIAAKFNNSRFFDIGNGHIYSNSADDTFAGLARLISATAFSLMPTAADLTTSVGSVFLGQVGGFTATLAAGDQVAWNIFYEAA